MTIRAGVRSQLFVTTSEHHKLTNVHVRLDIHMRRDTHLGC